MAEVVRQINWPAVCGLAAAGASLAYVLVAVFRQSHSRRS